MGETEHRITWWVYVGSGADRERIRHQASMRGEWAFDATCTCGWDSRTGGCVRSYIKSAIYDHKHFGL